MIDPIELLQLPVFFGDSAVCTQKKFIDVSTKFIYDNKVFLAVASDADCIGCQVGDVCPDVSCYDEYGRDMVFKLWSEM